MAVTNRFKGLDMAKCLKNYGWKFVTLYRKQWQKPSPNKEIQEGKVVICVGFILAEKIREVKGKGES